MRATGSRPAEAFATDFQAMTSLPPMAPISGLRTRVRLGRDYYVRLGGNDYSVDPRLIGKFVDIPATPTTVIATCDGNEFPTNQISVLLRSGRRAGGADLLPPPNPLDLLSLHQSSDLIPADSDARALGGLPELANPVDTVVLFPQRPKSRAHRGTPAPTVAAICRRSTYSEASATQCRCARLRAAGPQRCHRSWRR